mmetsp:Transcript_12651/g.18592  ORF Transcript_12651/g.18592 Transcript_12651/m.18592 type:complete len:87 (+) Transcript_12651:138-398(+)
MLYKPNVIFFVQTSQRKTSDAGHKKNLHCNVLQAKKVKMFNSQDDDVLDQISREVHSISEWKNLLLTWDSEKENLPFEAMSTTIPV